MSKRIEIDYNKIYDNYSSISRFDRNSNMFIADKIYWPFKILNESSYVVDKTGSINRRITIQFVYKNIYAFNTIKTVSISCINRPLVDDNYIPTFYGIGCKGQKSTKNNGVVLPEYSKWKSMIDRCYNPNHAERNAYYKTFVCKEWLCYEYFCNTLPLVPGYLDWVNNGFTGYDLDKDVLQRNSPIKIYSPETCMIIKSEYNSMHNDAKMADTLGLNTEYITNKQRLYTMIKGE